MSLRTVPRLTYSYDKADRLSEVAHSLDSNSNYKTLQNNTYNGLGQLTSASNGIFTTDYEYDMHSWLRRINVYNQNPLFEERLMYADSNSPCYNGNISAMTWKNGSGPIQRYNFAYDDASRLNSATYSEGNTNNNKYGTQYAYDCMGNITSLKRNGLQDGGTYGLIDDLTLSYDGNRLTSVSDAVTDPTYNNAWNFKDGADSDFEYEYDENGNLTKDLNKNISSIQYNSLNLPAQILFADGNVIRYTYNADGHKLRAVYTTAMPATTKTINYCGNLIFENGTLKQILVEGGYIMMDDWSHPYCFYIKDHLGNNRMVVNQRGTVDQVNNYYPYGGLMANSTGWNAQRYKYNGKEFDRMHGLDWYDYGARWQDAAIGGRWHAMDPLAEKYYDISPYVYCHNNPIMRIDPDGKKDYNVDNNGHFTESSSWVDSLLDFLGLSSANDRVYLNDKKLLAEFESGTIKSIENHKQNGQSYVIVRITNQSDANDLYNKLINYTDVEWGEIAFTDKSKGALLMNQHDDMSVSLPANYSLHKYKSKIKEFRHSHPLTKDLKKYGCNLPLQESVPSKEDRDCAKEYPYINMYVDEIPHGVTYKIDGKNGNYKKNQ